MAPLRIAVLSDGGSFYAPRLLAEVLAADQLSVEAVFVKTRRDSQLSSLRRVARDSGWRYTLDRAVALQRLRRRQERVRRSSIPWPDTPLPTWEEALPAGVPVVEIATANSDEFRSRLVELGIDLLLSTFYGEIVESVTLDTPTVGAANIHPSLLPRLRGTNPVFWALAEGLRQTGLTVHEMVPEIDAGVLIGQVVVDVEPDDTHHLLYRRIIETAAPMLAARLSVIAERRLIEGPPQDDSEASYFSKPTAAGYAAMRSHGHRFL